MRRANSIWTLLAAALPAGAHAQSTTSSAVTFALSWTESDPNGLPAGNGNGILEPGEHALIHLTVSFTNLNHTGTYSPFPPGPGSGTIRGFGSGFISLNGTSTNGGNAQGTWNVDAATYPGQVGTNPAWDLVQGPSGWGTSVNNGINLLNVQTGQFPMSNAAIVATDPIADIWKGVWTPASFTTRDVQFASSAGSGGSFSASVVFATTAGPVGASLDFGHTFFGSVQIPVVPAPGALAPLAVFALAAHRRRRAR